MSDFRALVEERASRLLIADEGPGWVEDQRDAAYQQGYKRMQVIGQHMTGKEPVRSDSRLKVAAMAICYERCLACDHIVNKHPVDAVGTVFLAFQIAACDDCIRRGALTGRPMLPDDQCEICLSRNNIIFSETALQLGGLVFIGNHGQCCDWIKEI